ncbi:MAG: hypothetical protein ACKVQS_12100 [Fimbriimonadaceae bacterium]
MHPSIITGTLGLITYIIYQHARTTTKTLKSQTHSNPTPQNKQKLKRQTILRDLIAAVAAIFFYATLTHLQQPDPPPTSQIQISP